jgi:hypothetical protein
VPAVRPVMVKVWSRPVAVALAGETPRVVVPAMTVAAIGAAVAGSWATQRTDSRALEILKPAVTVVCWAVPDKAGAVVKVPAPAPAVVTSRTVAKRAGASKAQ